MPIKKITSSPKVLAVSLILAIALLMFLGSISYKQIVQLGESADMVSHTLEVDMEINQLFSYYAKMQSTELKNLLYHDTLGISSYENFKPDAEESFLKLKELTQDNPVQQKILFSVQSWQDSLYNSLKIIANIPFQKANYSSGDREKITKVTNSITQLNLLKNQMYQEKQIQLEKHKEEYRSQILFTPLMTLLLGMFALFIFIISFLQINSQRKRTATAEKFLQNILGSTDNIISYFEPIYNNMGQVIDFTIVFTNEQIESVLGQTSSQIEQRKMSELIPSNFENGIFDELAKVTDEGETRKFEKHFEYNSNEFWFKTTAVKMEKGVLTTSVDTTSERNYTHNLRVLNEQLEKQNRDLIETKSFLNNILESTSNTVSHLVTERDSNGKIIDFKYVFTNSESENLTGKQVGEVIGNSISRIYPSVHDTGLFDLMVKCANSGTIESHESEYFLNGKSLWVNTTLNKLNDGITLTSFDSTQIINAKQRLLELNEQLMVQNSILNDAEAVAKIGSYRWNIETQEATMSDNFFRLLDCEPNEFKPAPENYRPFVHPKDLTIYDEKLNLALEKKIVSNFTYRIITKNGKVKHLQNTGHFLKTEFIGVVKDITKDLKNEQKLKDKNLELKRINSELESFNRVASHDLQEPLRKIQMFISRIVDSNSSNFTEQQTQYITKVQSSANRMQNLIKYLLSYSRLRKKKKDLVNVDLNLVLDKVQEDLEAPIKESGVEFVIGDLPEVRGIPFQLEQLFNNLISNSIKYHSILDTPKIEIACKKMDRSSIPDDFNKKAKVYYCISVKDNGIGFEQANAKKIFELFQRLHQKNEYSGTGIGLAICKKIVEKHKGHIVAQGHVNKGATFNIFLPVQII
tara:strand:- start:164 stop:2752 length:2589 start_codon:yes stop_codon:yes gene_type:complete